MTTEAHANEKITSCSKIASAKEKANPHLGREICLSEIEWFDLGLPYTWCTAQFVHVSTLPVENRVAVLRSSNVSASLRPADGSRIPAVDGRIEAKLPAWRLFTGSQRVHVEDYIRSPYSHDATSSFNVRPPELLIFNNLQLYCECFVVIGTQKPTFEAELASQMWLDGLSRVVKIRSCSVDKAITFLVGKASDQRAVDLLEDVFGPIEAGDESFLRRFVKPVDAACRECVAVISFVKPWDKTKFLTHLCLSLGNYETEVDLFMVPNMRYSLFRAGLLQSAETVSQDDIDELLTKYVMQDLRFHPISSPQFGRYLKAARDTLQEVLIDDVFGDYTPCVSNVMLKDAASDELKQTEATRTANLIAALNDDDAVRGLIPQNLAEASLLEPLDWVPHIPPVDGISAHAIHEQNKALRLCVNAIDKFRDPRCMGLKFPCLVGRAGSGKSHVLKLAMAYAIGQGYNVELMSWTSERARKLGGNHLHLVFPLQVSTRRTLIASDIANNCLAALDRSPMKKAMLARTDMFFFEEIGLLSSEYYTAIDTVMRALMKSTHPFGSKLFLSCGDSKQLPPIQGRCIWSSINMSTMMDVFVFNADVRARDENLRWLNNECRRSLNEAECTAVANMLVAKCRFKDDWKSVPDVAVRIVPTKAAEMTVTNEFLSSRKTTSYDAVDEVQNGLQWKKADDRISMRLNKEVYEYDVCKLYRGAIVRMTFNKRDATGVIFSQGQLAIVVRLPAKDAAYSEQRLTLRLAEPGKRIGDVDIRHIPATWREVTVSRRTTPPVVVGRFLQMGRRTQFPVRYYLASTIHRIQGDTVPVLATELSTTNRDLKLWQREQLAVLISRVSHLDDIIFVGSKEETAAAIKQILSGSTMWDSLVDMYIKTLNIAEYSDTARHVILDTHPYLPMYRELPAAAHGLVYMLASLSTPNRHYIGQTMDLKKALREHNTGYGAESTRNTRLHPWGVYAFVHGFDHKVDSAHRAKELRVAFAFEWNDSVRLDMPIDRVYECGAKLADYWKQSGYDEMTVVKCGDTKKKEHRRAVGVPVAVHAAAADYAASTSSGSTLIDTFRPPVEEYYDMEFDYDYNDKGYDDETADEDL